MKTDHKNHYHRSVGSLPQEAGEKYPPQASVTRRIQNHHQTTADHDLPPLYEHKTIRLLLWVKSKRNIYIY